jgi:hypothetical protein
VRENREIPVLGDARVAERLLRGRIPLEKKWKGKVLWLWLRMKRKRRRDISLLK